MKLKPTLLAAAAVSGLYMTSAFAVDFEGYFRVGPGQKSNSGDKKRCFGGGAQGGKGGIGRLGNECETYGEFALSQTADLGGVKYKALLMTNFYDPGSDVNGTTTKVNQLYVEGTGYDIAPNQTFWVGRRFYGRADVHMDDAFFVDMTGTGAGVDGIPVAGGALGLSVFRNQDDASDYTPPGANEPSSPTNAATRVNIDLTKVPVNPGGQLRVTGVFSDFSGAGGERGAGLSVQHIQSGLFGGATNTLWLQGTQGSAYLNMGFGGGTDDDSVKRWRIVDSIAWLKGQVTAQTLFQYGEDKNDDGKDKFWSVAGRAGYALTKNFKLQAELGHSSLKPRNGSERQNITKFTIAPTLTVGQDYYARPELRVYYSYFRYNDAYQFSQGQSKSNRSAVGLQAEIWF